MYKELSHEGLPYSPVYAQAKLSNIYINIDLR
jgi:hypothetical protein